jgi:hypothetical protein
MKPCTKCGVVQPLTEFYSAKGTRDGLRGDCKTCFKQRAADRYRKDPERVKNRVRKWEQENREKRAEWQRKYRASGRRQEVDRRTYLKRTHGITPEQYDAKLEAQGGVCAICGAPPREDISLHVDHDHATGDRRGLLCFRCNNALGDFGDDYERLVAASIYLLDHDPEMQELGRIARERVKALKA